MYLSNSSYLQKSIFREVCAVDSILNLVLPEDSTQSSRSEMTGYFLVNTRKSKDLVNDMMQQNLIKQNIIIICKHVWYTIKENEEGNSSFNYTGTTAGKP